MVAKLEVKSELDMVNGIDMRISNISLIIYCALRYIFMAIWRIWGEEALPIVVDASTHSRTSGAYNCQFLSRIDAKLCLSFAYDCNISRRWTAMMVNNSIIALGAVHERDICLKGDELI